MIDPWNEQKEQKVTAVSIFLVDNRKVINSLATSSLCVLISMSTILDRARKMLIGYENFRLTGFEPGNE
jgi:hypothetical protein